MFGGSYFGESPFASPPTVIGAVKKSIKWLTGAPGLLWNAMRARSDWTPDAPTENDQTREPGTGWDTDSPVDDWKTGDL